MSQHTPGPWKVVPYEKDSAWECIEARGAHLACVSKAENPANARLIAAAPELLAALEQMAAECRKKGPFKSLPNARAAIRAAKGESNG